MGKYSNYELQAYKGMSIAPHSRPYIGIVESYSKDIRMGTISLGATKTYIHNEDLNINIGDVVIYMANKYNAEKKFSFFEHGENEIVIARNIDKLINNKEIAEAMMHNKFYDSYTRKIIISIFKEFAYIELEEKLNYYKKILSTIDDYVDTMCFEEVLSKYSITLEVGGFNKPGGDDRCWSFISSNTRNYAKEYDVYLNNLLPNINIEIFRDSGFCRWQSMLEKYDRTDDEIRAKRINDGIKYKAERLYSKTEHKKKLKKHISNSLILIEKEYLSECKKEVDNLTLRFCKKINF